MNRHNEQNPILLVTLTVGQLQDLIRQELQSAFVNPSGNQVGVYASQLQNPYLTVKEAAKIASLAPSTIRLFLRKGELNGLKVGRRVVIGRADLDRFLRLKPLQN
jgi:excisionase family DNA binding protein